MRGVASLDAEEACHSQRSASASKRESKNPFPWLRRARSTRPFSGALLRLRHLDAAGVDRHISLNFHLERCADIQFHIGAMLQQSPGYAACDPGEAAVSRSIEAACRQAPKAPHRPSDRRSLGFIFNTLAGVFVLLDGSFLIRYTLVVSPGSVVDRSRQHDRVPTGINHRGKV